MTLIEVLVALSVVAILLLPLAAVFYTGATANADNREYGAAIGLADQALAEAEAVTYSSLGFYDNQFYADGTPAPPGLACSSSGTDPIPGYNNQDPVDLGCPPSGQSPQVQPVDGSLQVGGTRFTLTTYIVWVAGSYPTSDTTNPYSDAYKQVYAVVTWKEGGNPVTAVQSILVYPGGLGAYSGPGNNGVPANSSGTPPSVNLVGVSPVTATNGASSELDVTWYDPPNFLGYYAVVGSTNPNDLPTSNTSGGDWNPAGSTPYDYATPPSCAASSGSTCTELRDLVTGLAASTTYWFEVVAFSSDGTQWTTSQPPAESNTTAAPPATSCTITSLTIDQTGQPQSKAELSNKAGSAGRLIAPVTFTAPWTGCSSSDTVTVSTTSGPATLGPWTLTFSSNPPQYTYTLCPAQYSGQPQTFAAGDYTFSVAIDGSTQASVTTGVTFTTKNKMPSC